MQILVVFVCISYEQEWEIYYEFYCNWLLLVQVLDDEVLERLDAALDGLDVNLCKE